MKDAPVRRAVEFIKREQEPDGSWFGRWGVNYIYGTFLVLRGLEAMGMWNHEPAVQQAAEWIRMVQNTDGGWGEHTLTAAHYLAWALLEMGRYAESRDLNQDTLARRRRVLGQDHPDTLNSAARISRG